MADIKIIANDPYFDAVAWVKEKADAERMAEAHYQLAVLTGGAGYKIEFFASFSRARDIGIALDKYFQQ